MIRFENFDPEHFLREYWQRKPLLIRGAVPAFTDPLSAEELAGLALEDDIESRIVETRPGAWGFRQGPFGETDFDSEHPWTLLVQAVDHALDEVAALRQLVSFLPNWRFDDIMVSYASPGAGVGPHYDNYDVFLLQGAGSRRWRLGQFCDDDAPLIEHPSLRILQSFEDSAEHTLEAGDVLYIPPRLAHWGESIDDSMTYSLGYRAPRLNDMISRAVDGLLENIGLETLYTDPALQPDARPGEINSAAIEAALAQLRTALKDAGEDSRWFGELVTESPFVPEPLHIEQGDALMLDSAARLAWQERPDALEIYANGLTLLADLAERPAIEALCSGTVLHCGEDLSMDIATPLAAAGCLRHA